MDLIVLRPQGLYCPLGDFYIDPWRPVDRAVITHAHSDHARMGHVSYLCTPQCAPALRARLGEVDVQTLPYGESLRIGSASVSFHPAGHVLGSAQVRVEYRGEVWVASGDYKTEVDPTCDAFVPVRCDTFITESTFGLPVYRWAPQESVFGDMAEWWAQNAAEHKNSVLFCYAFGKSQRVLHALRHAPGPVVVHGALERLNEVYTQAGVELPETLKVADFDSARHRNALIVAPPSARGSPWLRRFGEHADAFASGWMQVRGARRRRGVDRGFVLSDHADWPGLQSAIRETGASRVYVTHGSTDVMQRWLIEQSLDARTFQTEYGGEEDDVDAGQQEAREPA